MSTHKRLAIAFLVLLAFFGINVVIHSWGSARRSASFEVLRQAITRQALLESAGKELGNVQKEMALLSEVYSTSAGPMDAAESARFERQPGVHGVDVEIHGECRAAAVVPRVRPSVRKERARSDRAPAVGRGRSRPADGRPDCRGGRFQDERSLST